MRTAKTEASMRSGRVALNNEPPPLPVLYSPVYGYGVSSWNKIFHSGSNGGAVTNTRDPTIL